jgi:hypothetical protein
MTDHHGGEKPKITMELETRPSLVSGLHPSGSLVSFWLLLRYGEHCFERLLPEGFSGWDDASRDLAIAEAGEELRKQLRPILIAEDRKLHLVGP